MNKIIGYFSLEANKNRYTKLASIDLSVNNEFMTLQERLWLNDSSTVSFIRTYSDFIFLFMFNSINVSIYRFEKSGEDLIPTSTMSFTFGSGGYGVKFTEPFMSNDGVVTLVRAPYNLADDFYAAKIDLKELPSTYTMRNTEIEAIRFNSPENVPYRTISNECKILQNENGIIELVTSYSLTRLNMETFVTEHLMTPIYFNYRSASKSSDEILNTNIGSFRVDGDKLRMISPIILYSMLPNSEFSGNISVDTPKSNNTSIAFSVFNSPSTTTPEPPK